ncbi:MAG: glycoside hydrolase family 127 protein [Ruminococcaceae bacterium]|nr:glycoside hydrolase family 127 protein [Oscillospiraceae bacterium]
MENISYRNVEINGGFWKQKQEINRKISAHAVYDRFYDTGRIAAFNVNWKEGDPHCPHIYWDSDVAKWIEGAAAILNKEHITEFEEKIESLIDKIEENQQPDGYFNIYYILFGEGQRFVDRKCHELYCLGHLIEAAVEYYLVTGRDKFLNAMKKYVDLVYDIFCVRDSAEFTTPGHEEIELALFKLYRVTKDKKHLELAMFFLNKRGNNPKDDSLRERYQMSYAQSHLPVREQFTAEGHAVRAVYLFTAMADAAREIKDPELIHACEKLFSNITEKRMYITGGLGQTHNGEAFSIDYHLPNETAYNETCASIGMVFFCQRMLEITGDAKYADVIEKEIYNGALSGVSLDGKEFRYTNPLSVNMKNRSKDPSTNMRDWFPSTKRSEIFKTSCCPPNIIRFIAMMGDNIYSVDADTYYVHQFINSKTDKVSVTTDFPNHSIVKIHADVKELRVRIPAWCDNFQCNRHYTTENGYAVITDTAGEIEINLNLTPVLMEANSLVADNAGKVALMYGPMVYCIEGVDQKEKLSQLYIDGNLHTRMEFSERFGVNTFIAKGFKKTNSGLYSKYNRENYEETSLQFIPYFGSANRGETDMQVWVKVK